MSDAAPPSVPFEEPASIEESFNEYIKVIDAVRALRALTASQSKRLNELTAATNVIAQDVARMRADLGRCLDATTANGLMLEAIGGKFDQLLVELRKAVTRV